MLTTEVLTFKQIVTAATHVLVANKLPISRLRDLLLAPLATYVAYRAMRRMPGPGSWRVMVGNVIIILALVIAIVAVLTSLASA